VKKRGYAALTDVVDEADLADFKARNGFVAPSDLQKFNIDPKKIIGICVGLLPVWLAIGLLLPPTGLIFTAVLSTVMLIIITMAVLEMRSVKLDSWVLPYRLFKFATANEWSYQLQPDKVPRAGVLLTSSQGYRVLHRVVADGYSVGDIGLSIVDINQQTIQLYEYTYLAIPLRRHLPNFVLDAKSNNISLLGASISNLPAAYTKNQISSLEGDFDKYFTVYAPNGYDTELRYFLTPDVMAKFLEMKDFSDIEIVDDTFYVYYDGAHKWLDEEFWTRADEFVAYITKKTVKQSARYSDTKLHDNDAKGQTSIVSRQGRRLQQTEKGLYIGLAVVALLGFLLIAYNNKDYLSSAIFSELSLM